MRYEPSDYEWTAIKPMLHSVDQGGGEAGNGRILERDEIRP